MASIASEPTQSNLRIRLISSLIGLPLLALVIWVGSWLLVVAATIVALVAAYEVLTLMRKAGWVPLHNEGIVWAGATVAASAFGGVIMLVTFGLAGSLALAWGGRRIRDPRVLGDWGLTAGGVAYVSLPLASIVLIRADGSFSWAVLAFVATFATDTGAYFVGRLIGRHQMAPRISPGKTWEGAIAGLASGIGVTVAFVAIPGGIGWALLAAVNLGVGIGLLSMVGDLLESKLKRLANVKDSGMLIPGHGGLLDRLDSLVLVFPLVYYASQAWPAS